MDNQITYSDSLNASLDAPALDPKFLLIANEALGGCSVPQISEKYGLEDDQITAVLERPEVKRYMDNVYLSQGYLHRSKRLKIITEIIDQKLEEARDTGIYSKKDLLDWMKLLNDMENNSRPRVPHTAVQVNQQTNNYTALLEDLFSKDDD